MLCQLAQTDEQFIAFQHFVNEQYRHAFPSSPGYEQYIITPAPPSKLPDGTPQEYALIAIDEQENIVAGMRMLVACDPRFPNLDNHTQRLFDVPGGDLQAYLLQQTGRDNLRVIEVGRLAVSHRLSIAQSFQLMAHLSNMLLETARQLDVDFLIGFARPLVINTLRRIGWTVKEIPELHMNRQNKGVLIELISCYEIKLPELGQRLDKPLTRHAIEAMNTQEMRALVDGVSDGEQVYIVPLENPLTGKDVRA